MRTILRCNVLFWLMWIISIVGWLHFPAHRCCAQHEVFDKSVIQKWKDYEFFSRNLQGTKRVTYTTAEGKDRTKVYHYKQNRECALYIVPGREPDTELCWLANPRYSAGIKRSTSDTSNAVLYRFDHRSTPETDTDVRTAIDGAFSDTSPHFHYAQSRLSQLVLNPSFKVIKVVKGILNGQELIRVDHTYTYDVAGSNKTRQERIRGSLYFDSSRCWCLRRFKDSREGIFRGVHGVDFEFEVEYETIDHPSGFPIIKTETQHSIQFNHKNKKKSNHESRAEFDLEEKEGSPNEEFTLAAFGLPEPGSDPVKKSIPLFVWILVAAGVCAALALGFRYLAHRRARTQASA